MSDESRNRPRLLVYRLSKIRRCHPNELCPGTSKQVLGIGRVCDSASIWREITVLGQLFSTLQQCKQSMGLKSDRDVGNVEGNSFKNSIIISMSSRQADGIYTPSRENTPHFQNAISNHVKTHQDPLDIQFFCNAMILKKIACFQCLI